MEPTKRLVGPQVCPTRQDWRRGSIGNCGEIEMETSRPSLCLWVLLDAAQMLELSFEIGPARDRKSSEEESLEAGSDRRTKGAGPAS